MGASCSCTEENKYRFKKFVVSVYPDNRHGGPNEDALGTLNSYVASNPERIPRICRKIQKIFIIHLRAQKRERVMVSAKTMRVLIEKAPTVDGFVPHSIEMCSRLLEQGVPVYLVGAADILCILCHRLTGVPGSESSRRLLANARDRLVPPLLKMAAEAVESDMDSQVMLSRYAAVLALGHMATCLHSALSSYARDMIAPLLVNLQLLLRERSKQQTEGDTALLLASLSKPAATSALLPETDVVTACILATCFSIGATAGCVTSAGVEPFLARVMVFLDTQKSWSVYLAPILIFRALAASMEARPQRLGFFVYQNLCSLGMQNSNPQVRVGVLRALGECVLVVPMSGGRPQDLLQYLLAVIEVPNRSEEQYEHNMNEAIVDLTASLLKAIYKQRNAPQLQSVLTALTELVRSTDSQSANVLLVLRCIAVAAPYVRTAPLSDRNSLSVVGALQPFLSSDHDQRRTMAVRALRGLLAGIPEDAADSVPSTAVAALGTDEADIMFAEEWLQTIIGETSTVTPRCMVQVANTVVAVMNGYGMHALPFVLNWLYTLQERCLSANKKQGSSPLTQAWLHMVIILIVCAGDIFSIRKLKEYGEDILKRRAAAKETATCFHLELSSTARPSERFTHSGLTARSETKKKVLSANHTEPPVTKLINFDFITSVLVDAERDDVLAAFDATASTLKAAIADTCFTAERKVSLQGEASRRSSTVASTTAVPFSLEVADGAASKIEDIEVAIADTTASRGGSTLPASSTVGERVSSVMAQYNVTAETSIKPTQINITEATPLPLFSSEEDGEGEDNEQSVKTLQSADSSDEEERVMAEKKVAMDPTALQEAQPLSVKKLWVSNLPSSRYINVD